MKFGLLLVKEESRHEATILNVVRRYYLTLQPEKNWSHLPLRFQTVKGGMSNRRNIKQHNDWKAGVKILKEMSMIGQLLWNGLAACKAAESSFGGGKGENRGQLLQ